MATKKGQPRRTARRAYAKKTHRRSKPVIHALPDLVGAAAIATLIVPSAENMWYNYTSTGSMGNMFTQGNLLYDVDIMKGQVIPAVEVGIAALVIKWGGKKLGLNRIGTKGVKVA